MHNQPATSHPDLVVGIDSADDAGAYRIAPDIILLQTVDFFTPIVDDARDWGRISATNALSDIYAMGGTPRTALQIVGWPRDVLPFETLGEVLAGGAEVLEAAACTIVGGHSVDDPEPKYGMAVTGVVHPDDLVTNRGAQAGDSIVLTKPLGTGIIATAIKRDKATDEQAKDAVDLMTQLNAGAARAMRRVGVHAATDVTGFGLLGHLSEMVRPAGLSAEVDWATVPFLDGVIELAVNRVIPGGSRRNHTAATRYTDFGGLPDAEQLALADAQTSGGLLVAVDAPLAKAFLQALEDEGSRGFVIGRFVERSFEDGPSGRITVTGVPR